MKLETLIYRWNHHRKFTFTESLELNKLLLAERDSLKRVVSAPQARNHEAAAKADLGPVSAPCARWCEHIDTIKAAVTVLEMARSSASGHQQSPSWFLQQAESALSTAISQFADEIGKRAEAARAAGAAQGEPAKPAAEAAR